MTRSTGAERIAAERARQIADEGFDGDHDDENNDNGELALAAICYAAPERIYVVDDRGPGISFVDPWPWDRVWDKRSERKKPTTKERLRALEKAGALIAAEIDRLERAR